jgi:hypothetical protein
MSQVCYPFFHVSDEIVTRGPPWGDELAEVVARWRKPLLRGNPPPLSQLPDGIPKHAPLYVQLSSQAILESPGFKLLSRRSRLNT